MTHMRVRYHRPSFQGGDAFHPLCRVPVTGWAGPGASAEPMTDHPRNVDCENCRRWMDRGGVAARLSHLSHFLLEAPLAQGRAWREAQKRRAT